MHVKLLRVCRRRSGLWPEDFLRVRTC